MVPSSLRKWLVGRRVMSAVYTYSLGFFFGPGLPLGFCMLSGMGVDLFTPFVAEPFCFVVPLSVNMSWAGAGVEFDSELFSCDAMGSK